MIKYLEKLLNGREVEWKKLGDACEIKRGRVLSKKYLEDNKGQYPVYSSQTVNNGEIGKINSYDYDGEYLTWTTDGAYAGTVFYRNEKFSITNICGLIDVKNKRILNIKFLFYWLQISTKNYVTDGSGNPKLMSNVVEKIDIPIPPLDIQEEIVRVLDKFTEHTKELTKELTLRKKEYSYYRDYLLEFNNIDDLGIEVNRVNLIDCCDIVMGVSPEGKTLSEIKLNNNIEFHQGKTYFTDLILGFSNIYTSSPLKYAEPNSIVMSVRAPVGDINIVDRNISIGRGLCMIKNKEEISNLKYIYHYIKNNIKELKSKSKGATFESITSEDIKNFKINLPSLEIQERIVNVLDNFEKICNDLNIGLPKEVELRQKEYEYYRESILTNIGNKITLEDKTRQDKTRQDNII